MNFLKSFLASLLAVIVAFGLMAMMSALIIVGMIASLGSATPPVPNNSVLRLNPGTVTDSPAQSILDDFDFLSMTSTSRTTILSTVSAIQAAADDNRIKGIYINFDEYTRVSLPQLEEIRAALEEFRESGKFIIAYNETWSHAGYFLASVADKIYLHPEGSMQWEGLFLQVMFYKGLLDKLDIEPVIFRHGTFKSAVEPFMYDKMSAENRLQYQALANTTWSVITDAVSRSRGIPVDRLNEWADNLAVDSPGAALGFGLVDGLRYEDQVMSELGLLVQQGRSGRKVQTVEAVTDENGEETWVSSEETVSGPYYSTGMTGTGEPPRIIQFRDYAAQMGPAKGVSKNKIAVIYAEGDIVDGDGNSNDVGSATMVRKLQKARTDPNVKAVVVRVNSPGGSALASDVIWREIELLKKKAPVIVSMGTYAASGGYYISCPADVIYANKTTLTGSIGVFGLTANIGNALRNNLGITVDGVNTNAHSDVGSMFRDVTPGERAYIQKSVEQIYTTFVGHVAQGRNMSVEAVDGIGEGRVWTGADAMGIGLVDGIGGIVDAISIAADRTGVSDNFRLWEITAEPKGFSSLLGGVSARVRESVMRNQMGDVFIHYNQLKNMVDENGVQARMPYVLDIQ